MILMRPIISENSLKEASAGRFSFAVVRQATGADVKKAVEKIFSVSVSSVKVIKVPAKPYRAGKARVEKKRPSGKKAVVTLVKGEKIDLFEVGGNA